MPDVTMRCAACGSSAVKRDAWAEWDDESQSWVLGSVFDAAYCFDCEGETHIVEVALRERVRDAGGAAEAPRVMVAADLWPSVLIWCDGGGWWWGDAEPDAAAPAGPFSSESAARASARSERPGALVWAAPSPGAAFVGPLSGAGMVIP